MVIVRKIGKGRLVSVLALMTVGFVIYFGLFNYKPFIDFVFEFGDEVAADEFEPANSDVAFSTTLAEREQYVYGDQILQPSGIGIRQDRMLITTDTSDVFLTDREGNVKDSVRLKGGPLLLRQGFSEGVTWTGDSTAAVIAGEGTQLILLLVSDDQVAVDRTVSLELPNPAGSEAAAISYHEPDGTISLTLTDNDSVRVLSLNLNGTVTKETIIELPGLDPEGQGVVGSATLDTIHYVLLSRNVVLTIDVQTNELLGTWALDYDADVSGIAVAGGELVVTTDHEYYEASPTLKSFELPPVG